MKTRILVFLTDGSIYYTYAKHVDLDDPVYASLLSGSEPDKLYKFPAGQIESPTERTETYTKAYFRGRDIQKVLFEKIDAGI